MDDLRGYFDTSMGWWYDSDIEFGRKTVDKRRRCLENQENDSNAKTVLNVDVAVDGNQADMRDITTFDISLSRHYWSNQCASPADWGSVSGPFCCGFEDLPYFFLCWDRRQRIFSGE